MEGLRALGYVVLQMEKRGGEVDGKIAKLDEELLRYKQQMAKMRPGPAKNQVQQRALRVLKQKKMYEKQRDALYNQSFNVSVITRLNATSRAVRETLPMRRCT